jgi:isopenicillin-N N-acyltransferase-like protein
MYPHVRVEGGARERGRQYGEEARERVRLSVDAYAEVFAHWTGWSWELVVEEARRFERPIAEFDEKYVEELGGIAEGAGLSFEDVLALNVRTEVMFSAKARAAVSEAGLRLDGCTAFAVLPEASAGRTLIGQNWDWLLHAPDTVVVLEARQDEGPDFVTVVEAGLLAKAGLNSSGIGLATNALATEADTGAPGVPYHVVLRAILDAENLSDALATVQRRPRSSSANYLVAHEDGIAVDVEAAPGDFSRLFLLFPDGGVLLHTNHFLSGAFDGKDVGLWVGPDSPFRLERAKAAVEAAGVPLSPETFMGCLGDHANFPSSVCCHPDERAHPGDQGTTAFSIVMELDTRRIWLADGQPCSTPYRELDYSGFLAKPSAVKSRA